MGRKLLLSDRKGFSLVEIVIVTGIFFMVAGVLVLNMSNTSKVDEDFSQHQRYDHKLALLQNVIRSDVRSSLSMSQPNERTFVLKTIVVDTDASIPRTQEVIYSLSENKKIITRECENSVRTFDFSELIGSQNLTLSFTK